METYKQSSHSRYQMIRIKKKRKLKIKKCLDNDDVASFRLIQIHR